MRRLHIVGPRHRIQANTVRQQVKIRVARPDLAEGFHSFEASTGLRWTNGDAALPRDFPGHCEVTVHLGATTHYIDDGKVASVAWGTVSL